MGLPGLGTADFYGQAADAAERIAAILKVIGEGERFLVCSHAGPDGDAVGSMIAMGMLLEKMGKRAHLVSADRVPVVHRWLPGADRIEKALRVHGPYDAVILLECDGLERTRLQVIRADELVNRTLDKVESATDIVHRTVVSPARQISGIFHGVTAGLEFLVGGKRRQRNGMSVPQDEMFI